MAHLEMPARKSLRKIQHMKACGRNVGDRSAVSKADRPGKSGFERQLLDLQWEVTGDKVGFSERLGQKSYYSGSMTE